MTFDHFRSVTKMVCLAFLLAWTGSRHACSDTLVRWDIRYQPRAALSGALSSSPRIGAKSWDATNCTSAARAVRGGMRVNAGAITNQGVRFTDFGKPPNKIYTVLWIGKVYVPVLNHMIWCASNDAGNKQYEISFSSVSGQTINNLTFSCRWSGSYGSWRKSVSNLGIVAAGQTIAVAVSYDGSATTNLPIIMIDSGRGLVEYPGYSTVTAPSGTLANTAARMYLGNTALFNSTVHTNSSHLLFEQRNTFMSAAQLRAWGMREMAWARNY